MEALALFGVAVVFAYHIGLGSRTGVVRFPVNLFSFQEVDRQQNLQSYRGLMLLNLAGYFLALGVAGAIAWHVFPLSTKPVERLETLNGCYEGEGLPDFLRPPMHWGFRLANGVIFDRNGKAVSSIRLVHSTPKLTFVSFAPGILMSVDEHKNFMVYSGDTTTGKAYFKGSRAKIALDDDWGNLMLATSCQ